MSELSGLHVILVFILMFHFLADCHIRRLASAPTRRRQSPAVGHGGQFVQTVDIDPLSQHFVRAPVHVASRAVGVAEPFLPVVAHVPRHIANSSGLQLLFSLNKMDICQIFGLS